jgi:hypothetical protein
VLTRNISQIEDLYNYIQKKLYDTLSFGLLFLKDKDEPKYRELMFYIIEPFFEGLNGQGNIKKLFGSKKSLYKNSAIYKVFTKNDADVFERKTTRMDDLPPKKGMSSSLPKKKINFGKADTRTSMKNKPSNKKKNKTLLFIRGNPTQITNNIFVRILNFYKEKKYLFNKNNNILLFYYKDEIDLNENEKNNKKNNTEYIVEQEKKRINMFIKKLIPNIFSEIKKSSTSSYL